jgi:hypothetical protein
MSILLPVLTRICRWRCHFGVFFIKHFLQLPTAAINVEHHRIRWFLDSCISYSKREWSSYKVCPFTSSSETEGCQLLSWDWQGGVIPVTVGWLMFAVFCHKMFSSVHCPVIGSTSVCQTQLTIYLCTPLPEDGKVPISAALYCFF